MKRGQPLRRLTPLHTRTPLRSHSSLPVRKPLERGGAIKAKSAKRAREERVYGKLRAAYLDANPRCGFPPGCAWPATEIHHRKGRVGSLYLATEHWVGLCHAHHEFATLRPAQAVAMGLSELRVTA